MQTLPALRSAALSMALALLPPAQAQVRFVVNAFALPEMRAPMERSTLGLLEDFFGKGNVELVHLSIPETVEAVKRGEADILLSSAGVARRCAPYGTRQLVTSVRDGLADPNRNEGSAIVVRREKGAPRTLIELKGKTVAANFDEGFSGWQIALGEIAFAGEDPERFFSRKRFFGRSDAMEEVARAVVDGTVDAGVLRLCALEKFEKEKPELAAGLEVIAPPEGTEGSVPCRRSTRLYPAQTISVMPSVSPELSRHLLIGLLTMPPGEDHQAWAVATDFQSVDRLFEVLKIGPYAHLREWTLKKFLERFWPGIALALFAVLGLWLHDRRSDHLVRKARRELIEAEEMREKQNARIAALQRAGAVNQLSSLIAHEIHQPLSAIRLYAEGLGRQSSRRALPMETVQGISEKIVRQAERARLIVDRVRDYARRREPVHRAVNLAALLEHLREIQSKIFDKTETAPLPADGAFVRGSALELELALLNVVRNAVEAASKAPRPRVAVRLEADAKTVRAVVSDNGPRVSDETFASLSGLVTSEKPEGLGMGLSIVKNIVESHKGTLEFRQAEDGVSDGITVVVSFPRLETEAEEGEQP